MVNTSSNPDRLSEQDLYALDADARQRELQERTRNDVLSAISFDVQYVPYNLPAGTQVQIASNADDVGELLDTFGHATTIGYRGSFFQIDEPKGVIRVLLPGDQLRDGQPFLQPDESRVQKDALRNIKHLLRLRKDTHTQ